MLILAQQSHANTQQKEFLGPCGILFLGAQECYSHSADGWRYWNSTDSLGDSTRPPQTLSYSQPRQLQPRASGSPLHCLSGVSVEQQPGRARGGQPSNKDQKKKKPQQSTSTDDTLMNKLPALINGSAAAGARLSNGWSAGVTQTHTSQATIGKLQ